MQIDKICRACLRKDDEMIDMSKKDVYQKFLLFANLNVEEIPDIPLNLCQSCEKKLNISMSFKEECQKSHEILLNYIKNTREVKFEATGADTHQVDSEAPTLLNNVKNTCEVDSEATVVTYVSKPTKKLLRLEQFSKYKVLEAIEELKQGFHKNTNCIHCSYVGKNSRALSAHIFRVHKNLKLRWCCLCNAEFDNLTDHVATNHKDDYTCKFCSKKFHNKGLLTEHLHGHSDVKRFPCSFCKSSFVKKTHLNVHLRKHVKEEPFKCGSCDESFTQLHWLKTHLKTHRSEGDAVKQLAALKLKATADANKPLGLQQISQNQVWEAINDLKQSVDNNKVINCIRCSYVGSSSRSISQHISRMHKELKSRWCCVCNAEFDNLANHSNHYPCKFCSETFQTIKGLTAHLCNHSDVKLSSCSFCNRRFTSQSLLNVHLIMHTKMKLLQCGLCKNSFTKVYRLKNHLQKHKSEGNADEQLAALELLKQLQMQISKARKCRYCDKKYASPSELARHERIHTGDKPYICQVCGKNFTQMSTLKTHLIVHNIGNKINCNVCNKKFTSQTRLREHLRSHTGEKPFVCTECGKAFTQNRNLVEHNRFHTDLRPYQCYNCDKSFKVKKQIREHMLTHSDKKPYKCNQCSCAYKRGDSLTHHMKQHEVDKPQADRPHVCLMCYRTFTTDAMLKYHINTHNVSFLEI